MGQENSASKMFMIISLRIENRPRSQVVCTLEYRQLNQPITENVVPERCNDNIIITLNAHMMFLK